MTDSPVDRFFLLFSFHTKQTFGLSKIFKSEFARVMNNFKLHHLLNLPVSNYFHWLRHSHVCHKI